MWTALVPLWTALVLLWIALAAGWETRCSAVLVRLLLLLGFGSTAPLKAVPTVRELRSAWTRPAPAMV